MTKDIIRKQKNCEETGLSAQPQIYYIVDQKQYYIKCYDISYKCNTILKAVDISLKLHMVLNLRYDPICFSTYTFLQKCIFKIDTEYDSVSPSLSVLMKKVELHCNNNQGCS